MKERIDNLKDYAELAWASYFKFDFLKDSNNIPRKIYELDANGNKIKDENSPRGYKEIEVTLEHIASIKYKEQEVLVNLQQDNTWQSSLLNMLNEKTNIDKLNGEFSEIQAKNFAKRYEIRFHQPNTSSGFSATLFYDTQKDRFIVGFRGTEFSLENHKRIFESILDITQDVNLTLGTGDFQLNDLKQFLLDIAPTLKNVDSNKIIFVGHSLGGYLAVMAMQFCDTIDRMLDTIFNQIKFTASQVYTFNSPAIDGIGNMAMRVLAELRGSNILEQILNPQKVYHVYDNGGIKIIASAQYSSSNRLPIHTGQSSHSIIPLTQTLYLYSYLLELDSNHQAIQDAIANKQSNKATNTNNHIDSTLADYIQELNTFMENLKTYTLTFIDTANEANTRNFSRKNALLSPIRKKPESITFLPYLLSQIAVIIGEVPNVLQNTQDNYYERHKQVAISDETIIDFIIKLCEKQLYINICNKEYFNKMRKEAQRINDKENLGEKIALGTHRNFYVVNKNGACIENYESIVKVYGYKSDEYEITQQVWEEQYLGALCKVSQALYANGKAQIGIQYAK